MDSSCELQAVMTKNSSRIVLTNILRVMLAFLQSHGWSTDTAFYTKAGTARPTGVGLVDCVRTVTVAYGPPCRGVGRWWLYVSGNREARLSPGLLTSGSVALGYLPSLCGRPFLLEIGSVAQCKVTTLLIFCLDTHRSLIVVFDANLHTKVVAAVFLYFSLGQHDGSAGRFCWSLMKQPDVGLGSSPSGCFVRP